MEIQWYGHSCFLIKNSLGKRILTDPFDANIGYTPYTGLLDVVTISHFHFDHCYTEKFSKDVKIINREGIYHLDFVTIKGFPSFHDDQQGVKRGNNTIFIYELDDLRICHLGDLGHKLTNDFIELLGPINVLLIPVGSEYTLNGVDAAFVTNCIKPNYVIPMHYKTPNLSFLLDGAEKFLNSLKKAPKVKSKSLIITKDTLPKNTQVVILQPISC